MNSRNLQIEGIGLICFERSARAKRLNITLKPFRNVRVAVPYGITFSYAEKIVRKKIPWIKKHFARMTLRQYRDLRQILMSFSRCVHYVR